MFRSTTIPAAILATALFYAPPASALSVKDFEAKPPAEQSEYIVAFLEKMTYDLGQKNPQLAHDIKSYFVSNAPGAAFPEGLERVNIELGTVERLARQGKADLSNIQLESIVVYVVKQKFPPQK